MTPRTPHLHRVRDDEDADFAAPTALLGEASGLRGEGDDGDDRAKDEGKLEASTQRPVHPLHRKPADLATRLFTWLAIGVVAASLVGPRLVGVELPADDSTLHQPARVHVRADRDLVLVDEEATRTRREERALAIRSVWDLDVSRAQQDARWIGGALGRLAESVEPAPVDEAVAPRETGGRNEAAAPPAFVASEAARARLAGDLALIGAEAPQDAAYSALVQALGRSPDALELLMGDIREGLLLPVVGDRALLARDEQRGVVIRSVPPSLGRAEQIVEHVGAIRDLPAARAQHLQSLERKLVEPPFALSPAAATALSSWSASLLRTTLTYNAAESDQRRRAAVAAVHPELVRVRRGEMVLRPGEIVTERHLFLLRAMERQQGDEMRTHAALGSGAFVLTLCLLVYRFGARDAFRQKLALRDLWWMGGMLNLTLVVGLLADRAIAPASEWLRLRSMDVPPLAFACAIPLAWGAMQARLLIGPEVSLLFAVLATLLGAVMVEPGPTWAMVALVSSMAGIALVGDAQGRWRLVMSGLVAGGVAGVAALALESFRGALSGEQLSWVVGATLLSGGLAGLLCVIATPMAEALFGYVTSMRLASLAHLDQPLLKDLLVQAPGTWQHSVRMAELAEEGALEIGAHAPLVRVMALYHDVGKGREPLRFEENARGAAEAPALRDDSDTLGERRVLAHGVQLAKRARLPRVVVRAMLEVHSSSAPRPTLSAARGDDAVRAGGACPSTRESALLLLAEHVDMALLRSAPGTEDQRSAVVDDVFHRVLQAQLLRGSPLSFQDLERARLAFQRTTSRWHAQLSHAPGGGAEGPRASAPR